MPSPEPRASSGPGQLLEGRVAVVIPAHDHGHFIVESIRSALAQGECVAEVIVVDDGSTDDTVDAARRVGDSRVRVIRHAEARGPSAARNTGWRATRAEWLFFLDADDALAPVALRALLTAADSDSSEEFPSIPYGYQRCMRWVLRSRRDSLPACRCARVRCWRILLSIIGRVSSWR